MIAPNMTANFRNFVDNIDLVSKDLDFVWNSASAVVSSARSEEKCKWEDLNITWSPEACSVPATLTSSSLRSRRLTPPQAMGCVLMKALVTFAAGHHGSSWNNLSDIELEKASVKYCSVAFTCMQLFTWEVSSLMKALLQTLLRKHAVKPMYNQTTEFRLTFSRESHGDDEACALSPHWRWCHLSLFANHQPVANGFPGTVCVLLSGHSVVQNCWH